MKPLGANEITAQYPRGKVFCPHCECDLKAEEPVTDAGSVPGEGDVGVCSKCWKWWQIANGLRLKYTPTKEEADYLKRYLEGAKP